MLKVRYVTTPSQNLEVNDIKFSSKLDLEIGSGHDKYLIYFDKG
jgi:hypothetical protein